MQRAGGGATGQEAVQRGRRRCNGAGGGATGQEAVERGAREPKQTNKQTNKQKKERKKEPVLHIAGKPPPLPAEIIAESEDHVERHLRGEHQFEVSSEFEVCTEFEVGTKLRSGR